MKGRYVSKERTSILKQLVARGFPLDLLIEARDSSHIGSLAKLILAGDSVAERARKDWEYKSLADVGEEEFVVYESMYTDDTSWRGWEQSAIRDFSRAMQRHLHFLDEGLILFVRDLDGTFRPARAGDPAYDFVCRLRLDGSVGDLRFATAPTWAQELFLQRINFDAHNLMWCQPDDERYREVARLRADAVIRETRRMGGLPQSAGSDQCQARAEEDGEQPLAAYVYSGRLVKVIDLYTPVGLSLDLSAKQAIDFVERTIRELSIRLYFIDETGLGCPINKSESGEMLLDLWNSAQSRGWDFEELGGDSAGWGSLRVEQMAADQILSKANALRGPTPQPAGFEGYADDPRWPEELGIALSAWRAACNNAVHEGKRPGAYIRAWLASNQPGLTEEARKRIATVSNWDKSPGMARR